VRANVSQQKTALSTNCCSGSQNFARALDFGLAHTRDGVRSAQASGPTPGRTLHRKSGSTGAEDQLAKTSMRIAQAAGGLSNAHLAG
jgi:hypothetical protein